ncbi:MAG: radical SAM family heme chaperone HemW [Pseudomonadota bacterium]
MKDAATLLSGKHIRLDALPPLALYVHIPWCVRKCPYCDFNSHAVRGELPEREYVAALTADLEAALPLVWGRKVHTVFFGGGTPSLFSARAIDGLLAAIRARLPLVPDAEITLEANPGTFEAEKFAAYRASGINRLSVGIQSFDAQHLRDLGRIHDADEARRAVGIALDCFDNVNLDLMYALPRQTLEEAARDVASAADYGVPHLSVYHLTLEPNTRFHHEPPPLPDDDTAAAMQERTQAMLAARGYAHYEVSAYARPGFEARHNLNYWQFGDYLGIGAGAHSKISFADCILRQVRHAGPAAYMEHAARGAAVLEQREVAMRDLPFEFMMNALRLNVGFPTQLFEQRTGLPLTSIRCELDEAERRGFIVRDHLYIAPTELGRRFLNDLLQLFLHDPVG